MVGIEFEIWEECNEIGLFLKLCLLSTVKTSGKPAFYTFGVPYILPLLMFVSTTLSPLSNAMPPIATVAMRALSGI